ncbi:MAG TPA: M28 family peptidase [Saprospiraceae bacterium]|nr:M28 family peptidase [Saprospiraceae bacterium]
MKKFLFAFLVLGLTWTSCKTDSKPDVSTKPTPQQPTTPKKQVKVPPFNVDLAYKYVKGQLAFGPRVPGTASHDKARKWLVGFFKGLGMEVIEQNFDASSPDGKKYTGTNIIAIYKPEQKHRILLSSHWDSRYVSDHDEKIKDKPILGADDGASGVGILMSIAETLRDNPADIGVDFVLFDVEDQGLANQEEDGITSTWCQGSQYWAAHLHKAGYKPEFGILLDMVGGKDAYFAQDEVSMAFAGKYMKKVWDLAINMGYSNYFQNVRSSTIIDDHLFVNRIARIPMIDIINRKDGAFAPHWHTQHDDISAIDKSTLRAVGQTLLAVIYQSSVGNF